jgi:hypothetical protein
MGAKKPLTVGNRHFVKQGDAKEFYRRILWKYSIGQRLDEDDGIDVGALLLLHKEAEKKIGCGIDHFIIMTSEEGSRCFGIVRADGSKIDFSYQRCITQRWD